MDATASSGRKTKETNALSGVTTISYFYDSDNQLIKTNTYPDGGLRIETYYRDGSLKKVSGSATHPVRYEYGVDAGAQLYSKEIKLNSDGSDSLEFSTNFFDVVGRVYKTGFADGAYSLSTFNNYGQLVKEQDPDNATRLYQYNGKGEREYEAIDLNQNGSIDWTSDRITQTVRDAATVSSVDVNRTRSYSFMSSGSAVSNLVAESRISTDGLNSWDVRFGLTNQTTISYPGSGYQVTTVIAPDGSYTVTTNYEGRAISVTRRDSGGTQLSQTRYAHDYHGRQANVIDARNGTTVFGFNDADQVNTVVTPAPGNGQSPQTTIHYFDTLGRLTRTALPDGGSTANSYRASGELVQSSGTRTYPVGYGYDSQGRLTKMTNWSTFSGLQGERVTTWNYTTNRGFLLNKRYPDNQGPGYTYSSAGRLQTRTWARGVVTTYTNNSAGDLVGIGYSDGTSNVIFNLDRVGRRTNIIDAAGSRFFTLHDSGLVLVETNTSGALAGLSVTNGYDAALRRTVLAFRTNSSVQFTHSYGFDSASRMTNVSDGTYSAIYSYVANSPLVSQIVFRDGSTTRMTTTKLYDNLNRLMQISSQPSGSGQSPMSFDYVYNDANQRTRSRLADSSYWVYQYDSLGQVSSGKRYWSDGVPVAGQQFEYAFDDIGNRTSTKAGGDALGGSLRSATYGANTLNQYTNRTVSGTFDVLGIAHALSTTTVNTASTYRKGEYFQKAVTADNSTGAVYQAVTAQATYAGSTNTTTGNVFLAKSPEVFTYDADGNLTSDGHWTNRWDAENRLIDMEPLSSIPASARTRLQFGYDSQGRRISKVVSNWNGSSWTATVNLRFVYDGWNLLAELNATNNVRICSYLWGTDLSGNLEGAGGVGGLIAATSTDNGTHFPEYDGNGNVIGLMNASTGTNSALYECGPFGEPIRRTGPAASCNSFGFSTKFADPESDEVFFGFRYYSPRTGTWLSRDPIEERGGLNLYCLAENAPVVRIDVLGLDARGDWLIVGPKDIIALG